MCRLCSDEKIECEKQFETTAQRHPGYRGDRWNRQFLNCAIRGHDVRGERFQEFRSLVTDFTRLSATAKLPDTEVR
jgi:hypothetical protein